MGAHVSYALVAAVRHERRSGHAPSLLAAAAPGELLAAREKIDRLEADQLEPVSQT